MEFSELRPTRDADTISFGNDSECAVRGKGTIEILKFVNDRWHKAIIENVLYVLQLKKNLF